MGTHTLATYTSNGITLTNSGSELSPFTITPTGTVVTSYPVPGVFSTLSNPTLFNQGGIFVSLDDGVVFEGASGTVFNTGTIRLDDSGGSGVVLFGGGYVANIGTSAFIYGVGGGVVADSTLATVVNSGTIAAGQVGAALAGGGYLLNSGTSSMIAGSNIGVDMNGADLESSTLVNEGTIIGYSYDGIGFGGLGVIVNSGRDAVISASSTISTAIGINWQGTAGTVLNAGTVSGFQAMFFVVGGYVGNSGDAVISGYQTGIRFSGVANAAGTVVNSGTISAAGTTAGVGVYLGAGGSVTNAGNATISGYDTGVDARGSAAVVTNFRAISGRKFDGVYLGAGGGVSNTGNAAIYGYNTGVDVRESAAAVTNFGTISGRNFDGVYLGAGGSLANSGLSATISGFAGVKIGDYYATVTNTGSIIGTGNDGMYLTGGGYVSNTGPFADISGFTGIDLNGSGTVVNAGTITGTGGYGVLLTGGGTVVNAGTISGNRTAVAFGVFGDDRLVVDPGAVFIGAVNAGLSANYNVLELGAGVGRSTLSGIGTSFTGFNTVAFDGGATWLVTGDAAGFNNDSISGFAIVDTLDVTDLDFSGPSTVTADSAGVVTILESGGGSFGLTFSSAYDDDVFTLTSDGAGGTDITEFHGYTYSNIYGLYEPGTLPPGQTYGELFPTGVNDAGEVVGNYQTGAATGGFIYTDGTYTGFGPSVVGTITVSGYYPAAVNDAGEITGEFVSTYGGPIAFTYDDGTVASLVVPASLTSSELDYEHAYPTGINDAGVVSGYFNPSIYTNEDKGTPFIYENGTVTTLPNPTAESVDLNTTGMNDSNEIVGWFFDTLTAFSSFAGTEQGFIYNNGSYTTLSGPGPNEWVNANAINDSGEVVGVFNSPPEVNDQPIEGFIYNNGTYTTLSGPPGALQVDPVAINDSGEVAGTYILQDGFTEYGFVYQNGTYTTIADPTGTNGSPGVIVNDVVTGLNNAGDVIGYYAVAGTEYGFVADPACFAGGTRIATAQGKVAVEKLKIGDMVVTAGGDCVPVRWIGISTVAAQDFDPLRMLPVRIRAGALGEKIPERDLLVSPDHAFLLGGILVQAGAMVNGSSITREAYMPRGFIYYHVEVANHELILAEGAAAETFIDNIGRMAFDNWAEHIALYGGEAEIAEMPYPRAKSARQLPAALRRLLVQRAAMVCEDVLAP